jgi:DNA polymerase elongation subunit (family B)
MLLSAKEIVDNMEDLNTYVTYGDTDSVFIVKRDWQGKEKNKDDILKVAKEIEDRTNK